MNQRPPDHPPAVILDLDGTLVESAPDLMASLNVALTGAGRAPVTLAAVKSMIGDGMATLVARGFEATGVPASKAELDAAISVCLAHYQDHPIARSHLYPGVSVTLQTLRARGHRLAVCTNKPHAPALAVLDAFGILPLMDCVVGGDSYPFRKPDARMLTRTLARLAVTDHAAVMVGDSRNDALVADAARVPFVLATYGYNTTPLERLAPSATIDSFGDLPRALAELAWG